MEVDGGDGGDGIHAQAFRVGCQLLRVGGVVAGHVGNDGQLAFGLRHDVLQHHLALFLALVDALAGGAAHIDALHAFFDEPPGQCPDGLRIDAALGIVAGIERRENTLIFRNVLHINSLLIRESSP